MPKSTSPRCGAAAEAVDRVQQMRDLRAGEVGVDDQAGLRPKGLFQSFGLEAFADSGADAALPDDGRSDGAAGLPVPEDGRFPLVRQADRRHVGRGYRRVGHRRAGRCQLRRPDRLGVVLDDSRRRQDLRELLLRGGDDASAVVEDDRPAGRRALVESEDEAGHGASGHYWTNNWVDSTFARSCAQGQRPSKENRPCATKRSMSRTPGTLYFRFSST